jgi:hypothetical protein
MKNGFLSADLVSRVESANLSMDDIRNMEVKEIAEIMDTRPEVGRLI